MSDRTEKFSQALDRLIEKGGQLHIAIQYECFPLEVEEQLQESFDGDESKTNVFLEKIPSFKNDYQHWYTEAQAVIKQVLPDRLPDFVSYYEYPKTRKSVDFQNYMVRDYLQGLQITGVDGRVKVDGSAAIPEFVQQINIVKAAKATLESTLMDLKAVLQADLFDSEIDTAVALAKAGYLRASGAICGVVIEKHLHQVCEFNNIIVRKKNPSISDLNQLLKDSNITTVPQWRFIQQLADIRNICDHAKGREPTKQEIDDLVAGTSKVLKTVF
jgi:hypothetical protein